MVELSNELKDKLSKYGLFQKETDTIESVESEVSSQEVTKATDKATVKVKADGSSKSDTNDSAIVHKPKLDIDKINSSEISNRLASLEDTLRAHVRSLQDLNESEEAQIEKTKTEVVTEQVPESTVIKSESKKSEGKVSKTINSITKKLVNSKGMGVLTKLVNFSPQSSGANLSKFKMLLLGGLLVMALPFVILGSAISKFGAFLKSIKLPDLKKLVERAKDGAQSLKSKLFGTSGDGTLGYKDEFEPGGHPFEGLPPYKGLTAYDLSKVTAYPIISYTGIHDYIANNGDKGKTPKSVPTIPPKGKLKLTNTLGGRSNNPLDISVSSDSIGVKGTTVAGDGQKGFGIFDTPINGIASAMRLVKRKYGMKSVIGLNNGFQGYYSPTEPKSLTALRTRWITNVSKKIGIAPNEVIDTDDPISLMALTRAIAHIETSSDLDYDTLASALKVAYPDMYEKLQSGTRNSTIGNPPQELPDHKPTEQVKPESVNSDKGGDDNFDVKELKPYHYTKKHPSVQPSDLGKVSRSSHEEIIESKSDEVETPKATKLKVRKSKKSSKSAKSPELAMVNQPTVEVENNIHNIIYEV